MRILKVDETRNCVEFCKSGAGDSLLFFHQFNRIKEFMDDFANASF